MRVIKKLKNRSWFDRHCPIQSIENSSNMTEEYLSLNFVNMCKRGVRFYIEVSLSLVMISFNLSS